MSAQIMSNHSFSPKNRAEAFYHEPPKTRTGSIFKWSGAAASLFGIAAATGAACNPLSPEFDQVSPTPINFGGYPAYGPIGGDYGFAGLEQAKFVKGVAEMDAAIAACRAVPVSCHPNIKKFADFRDRARAIADERIRAEVVNAGVNMIKYDDAEAANLTLSNLDHHTLVQGVELDLVTCDEASLLKTYILAPQSTVFKIGETYYKDGKRQESGHAVAAIRIDDRLFALNIQTPLYDAGAITPAQAREMTIHASRIEPLAVQFNLSGQSFWAPEDNVFVPTNAFNTKQIVKIIGTAPRPDLGNVPEASRNAKAESFRLSEADYERYDVARIMAPAFAPLYTVTEPRPVDMAVTEAPATKDMRGTLPAIVVPPAPPPAPPARIVVREPVSATPASAPSASPFVPRGSFTEVWLARQCKMGVKRLCYH